MTIPTHRPYSSLLKAGVATHTVQVTTWTLEHRRNSGTPPSPPSPKLVSVPSKRWSVGFSKSEQSQSLSLQMSQPTSKANPPALPPPPALKQPPGFGTRPDPKVLSTKTRSVPDGQVARASLPPLSQQFSCHLWARSSTVQVVTEGLLGRSQLQAWRHSWVGLLFLIPGQRNTGLRTGKAGRCS